MRWQSHVVLVLGFGLGSAGCYDLLTDSQAFRQEGNDLQYGSGGGGTGGTGGAPPECIPGVAGIPVESTCGKFVSADGEDSNEGSKEQPFKTLATAIAAAKGDPVYVCTNGLSEALTLTEDATIYGGLDCTQGWKYVGLDTKTPWTASADDVPLILASGARATVEDIAFTAADATLPGGSSVAALAQVGAQLTLARCDVTAGDGADGAVGETPVEPVTVGVSGNPGKEACVSDADQTGGSSAVLSCGGVSVNSGAGGLGSTSDGGNGSDGKPSGATGKGGIGQIEGASECTVGGDGAAGMTGEAGLGAPMSVGTLGPDGYTGIAGTEGKIGQPGQGGGGGGGGKACASGKAGASGGSGGSGACGGVGGKGGKAGGSSIGIAVVGAKLALDTVNIVTKAGGKGGDGGAGQVGGVGGKLGAAGAAQDGSAACAGGKGGDGGQGGKGGGGLGGHSIGVAHTGDAPDVSAATFTTGTAGDGGTGDGPNGDGKPGTAGPTLGF